jgi:MoaA/NifB/PqqE/SkfB family radical SAM enzyme
LDFGEAPRAASSVARRRFLTGDNHWSNYFGLDGRRGPTAHELKTVQDACEGGAKLMRQCRQCRADAVGLLGEDRGQEFRCGTGKAGRDEGRINARIKQGNNKDGLCGPSHIEQLS